MRGRKHFRPDDMHRDGKFGHPLFNLTGTYYNLVDLRYFIFESDIQISGVTFGYLD